MASVNPFDLLGDEGSEDVSQLASAKVATVKADDSKKAKVEPAKGDCHGQ